MAEYQRGKPKIKQVIREAGVAIRPRGSKVGAVWSSERREAHRLATSSPEFAAKMRAATLVRLANVRESPAINTAIERRLHDALKVARIGFGTQSMLLDAYLVDIELHQAPIVIEADGATHSLPLQKAKDALRDAALADAGYRVFRFTGSEINTDATACVQRVIDTCGLVPDREPIYDIRTKFSGSSHPNWKGGKREFVCELESCRRAFLAQPSWRKGEHVYCSRQCSAKARAGVKIGPLAAEHRAKISTGKLRYHQIKVESDLRGDAQRAAETTAPATLF